jgi:hypothetical protein
MTREWDPDEAVDHVPADDDGDVLWRYGVTDWEAAHPEPLEVALAQENPDLPTACDEQWLEVDEDEPFPGRLVADEAVADDDYARAVDDGEEFAAEELAMHLVEP